MKRPEISISVATTEALTSAEVLGTLVSPWFGALRSHIPERVDYKEPIREPVLEPRSFERYREHTQFWKRLKEPKGSGCFFPKRCYRYSTVQARYVYRGLKDLDVGPALLKHWFASAKAEFGFLHLETNAERVPHRTDSGRYAFQLGTPLDPRKDDAIMSDLGWRNLFNDELAERFGIKRLSGAFPVTPFDGGVMLDLTDDFHALSVSVEEMLQRRALARSMIGEHHFMA